MAVAVDATGTAGTGSGTANTSLSYTGITVGSGANRALIFELYLIGGSVDPTSVTATWDSGGTNQAMTLLASQKLTTASIVYIFGLRAPTAGNKTLAASWTNGQGWTCNAKSFTGVDQVSDATAFPTANRNQATGNSTAAAITITSAVNNWTVTTVGTSNALSALNQTTDFHDSGGVGDHAGQSATGAATVSYTATVSPSTFWGYVGCDVAQVSAGGPALNNQSLVMM